MIGPEVSGKLLCPGAAARVAVVAIDFGVDDVDDEPLLFDRAALNGLRSLSLFLTASNPAFFLMVLVGIIMQEGSSYPIGVARSHTGIQLFRQVLRTACIAKVLI